MKTIGDSSTFSSPGVTSNPTKYQFADEVAHKDSKEQSHVHNHDNDHRAVATPCITKVKKARGTLVESLHA